MPIQFRHRDPDTGELKPVDYYTPAELAEMVHVSKETVWRNCANDRWPHLRVMRRYYFNAEQIERIMELMTHDPDTLPTWEPTRSLGIAIDPDDIEGVQ